MSIEMRARWAVPESTGLGGCIECFDSGGEFVYRITEDLKRLLQRENVAVRRKAGMLADRRPYSTEVSPVGSIVSSLQGSGPRVNVRSVVTSVPPRSQILTPEIYGRILRRHPPLKGDPHGQTTMIR
jgi:hypothetical protein